MNICIDIDMFLINAYEFENILKKYKNNPILLKYELIKYLTSNIDNDLLYKIKIMNQKFNKIYLLVPYSEVKNVKLILEEVFKYSEIDFTEIIYCNQEYYSSLMANRNIYYLISNNSESLNKYGKLTSNILLEAMPKSEVKNAIVLHDIDSIIEYIDEAQKGLEKWFKNTKSIGIPSIDEAWAKGFSIEQRTFRIPSTNIYNYVFSNVCNNLDATALIYFDKKYSFRQVFTIVDNYAEKLKEDGVKKGDIVTICMPNIPEAAITVLAINKIGAIISPLHPLLKADEMKETLLETESKYVITTDTSIDEILKTVSDTNIEIIETVNVSNSMPFVLKTAYDINLLKKKIEKKINKGKLKISRKLLSQNDKALSMITDEELYGYSGKPYISKNSLKESFKSSKNVGSKDFEYTEGSIAMLLRTGGTTGSSKLAAITNENCISNIEQLKYTIPAYKPFDVIEGIAPFFHGFGLVDVLLTGWSVNLAVDLHPRYDEKMFNRAVLKNKPSLILGPPTLFKAMINSKIYEGKDLSFLKVLICGSDYLDPGLEHEINMWLKEHGAENAIFVGLGLTEAVAAISFTGLYSVAKNSVGFPLPLNSVKIVDLDDGHELGYNEIGELCVSGPTVMKEYYHNSEETSLTLREENGRIWLHTGDICSITENGELIFIDRKKGIIIVSGINVYRTRIEEVVNTLREVEASAVIPIPHPYKMNVPKVYVVLKKGYELTEKLQKEFKAYCNSKLGVYEKIYEFEQIDSLPLSKLNKVDYLELGKREKIKRLGR